MSVDFAIDGEHAWGDARSVRVATLKACNQLINLLERQTAQPTEPEE